MKKVLVVEDDNINMQLVCEILNAKRFKTEVASDGLEAIRMTENKLYDFIDAGLDDYISKPIDVLDFIKRMEKYRT